MVKKLQNPLQNYDWGSHSLIQDLLGRPDLASGPLAEVWIGTHPKGPSRIDDSRNIPLSHYLAEEGSGPERELPFLLKILAAEKPLSIQVHPSKAQAEEGFLRENLQGVSLGAPSRNYKDDNHKPEVIYALTEFYGLCGFREKARVLELLRTLEGFDPGLGEYLTPISQTLRDRGLVAAVGTVLETPLPENRRLTEALTDLSPLLPEADRKTMEAVLREYPEDRGLLMPLFLNTFRLEPGQAVFTPAGILHAYVSGLGVEIMAASDNVVRGGLTAKHVDVPELMRITADQPFQPSLLPAYRKSPGMEVFLPPQGDFALIRISLREGEQTGVKTPGPAVGIVTEGALHGVRGTRGLVCRKGESAVFPQGGYLRFSGEGTLFLAARRSETWE